MFHGTYYGTMMIQRRNYTIDSSVLRVKTYILKLACERAHYYRGSQYYKELQCFMKKSQMLKALPDSFTFTSTLSLPHP